MTDSDGDNDGEECMIDVVGGGDSDDDSGPEDFSIRRHLTDNLNSSHNSDSSASDVHSTRNFSPIPGKIPHPASFLANSFGPASIRFDQTPAPRFDSSATRFDFDGQRAVSLDLTAGGAMASADQKNGPRKHNPFSIESLLNT